MDFFCVLSVGGSLTSYHVQKQNDTAYKAVLRSNNDQRDDVPPEIILRKSNDTWQAQPWHAEIAQSLINAIEDNSR